MRHHNIPHDLPTLQLFSWYIKFAGICTPPFLERRCSPLLKTWKKAEFYEYSNSWDNGFSDFINLNSKRKYCKIIRSHSILSHFGIINVRYISNLFKSQCSLIYYQSFCFQPLQRIEEINLPYNITPFSCYTESNFEICLQIFNNCEFKKRLC